MAESDEALLARIDALEAQNKELKGLVNDLKAELDATEKRLDEIEAAQSKGGNAGGQSKKEQKAAKKAAAKAAAKDQPKQMSKKEKAAAEKAEKAAKEEEKKFKAATKEGGKKGQDLIGMCDLGGMKYFTVAMEKCEGRWDLLEAAMAGAVKPVDEGGDDRKGGAGELGVCLLSCDEKADCKMLFHMPKALQGTLGLEEWAKTMTEDPAVMGEILEISEDGETLKAIAKTNKEKQLFPLKQRDSAINASFAMLRKKGLVADDDSDEDDFGDMYENAGVEW